MGTDASTPFGKQERNYIIGDLQPHINGSQDAAGAAADCGVSSLVNMSYAKEANY